MPTRISPDAVTLASLVLGVLAGHLFWYRSAWVNATGVLLFIISDVLDSADGQLAVVRAWPGQLETLPIWIDTTTALVAALRSLAHASLAHDAESIREAQRAYQAAADDGKQADRALAIAIAEGGSAISSGAMRSASDELAAVDDALAELASAS